jgi:hypothetical protein
MLDRWDTANLPTTPCHDPVLAVSDDGKVLAIFEPPRGQVMGAIYICSTQCRYSEIDAAERVVAWPFVLSTLEHDVDLLRVNLDKATGGYIVYAESQQHMMQWELHQASVFKNRVVDKLKEDIP